MRERWGNHLLNVSYLLFLLLYVFAAAAYGLTREAEISIFIWAAGGVFALWLVAHVFLMRFPSTGLLPWITVSLVLAFGWFVTVLSIVDQAVTDGKLEGWDEGFSANLLLYCSAYDPDLALAAMLRTSALLGMMLMAIEIWRHRNWGRALLATMVFSAFAMVIFFFLQRLFGGIFLLESEDKVTTLSFATYRYWGNSAAYLNLFWPIAAAVALSTAMRQSFAWALWIIPFALIFVANFMNVSKAGNVLAVVGFFLFIVLVAPACAREMRRAGKWIRKSHLIGAIVPILAVAICLPMAIPWQRWDYFAKTASSPENGSRLYAYSAFLKIIPDSGWMGFGPGSFKKYYFPYVENDPKLNHQSYWVAHQDYIQTVIEWGYVGTALWAIVLVPPGLLLIRFARQKTERPPNGFEGYRIGPLDYLIAFFSAFPSPKEPYVVIGAIVAIFLTALHSAVDFPMQIASLQLYFLVLLALGWSLRGSPRLKRLSED